jgi:hypothetical protein
VSRGRTIGGFGRYFLYSAGMQQVTITLPDELLAALEGTGRDLSRTALEALALEAYRTRRLSAAQLRHVLGFSTRMAVDAFLKEHGVALEYGLEDLERDRETHRRLGVGGFTTNSELCPTSISHPRS